MSDLVIVSNRGPFSFSEAFLDEAQQSLDTGKQPHPPEFGAGGLVQAMSALLRPGDWNTTWIGASLGDRDIDVARGHYTPLFEKMVAEGTAPDQFPHIEIKPDNRMRFRYRDYDFYMRFVFFDTRHMHSYYSKFANGFLWPLMHLTRSPLFYKKTSVFPRPFFEKTDFIQYMSSAVTFANTILDEIRKSTELWDDGDDVVIWNQDYHLMQIAEICDSLLNEKSLPAGINSRIHVGQFMHTPFYNIHEIQGLIREDKRKRVKEPYYDPFRESVESLLQKLTWGMLANDFIGFHAKEYCDNYLASLEEWFPVEIRVNGRAYEIIHQDRVTTIMPLPIGLDVDTILAEVSSEKSLHYQRDGDTLYPKMIEDKKKGRYIFGGLERCDYTKGLPERLEIFSHAFNRLRGLDRDARFYQVTSPSRMGNPDYQHLHEVLDKRISKMNDRLPSAPITHIDKGISAPQNYRFMKEIDVMLVTPLEDGMNLVAFEYILSQKPKRPEDRGILVLSSSGASRVLKQKGFGEEDGIVYVDPLKPRSAGEKSVQALLNQRHISDKVIAYVEDERRVDDWAEKNIQAILECRKTV